MPFEKSKTTKRSSDLFWRLSVEKKNLSIKTKTQVKLFHIPLIFSFYLPAFNFQRTKFGDTVLQQLPTSSLSQEVLRSNCQNDLLFACSSRVYVCFLQVLWTTLAHQVNRTLAIAPWSECVSKSCVCFLWWTVTCPGFLPASYLMTARIVASCYLSLAGYVMLSCDVILKSNLSGGLSVVLEINVPLSLVSVLLLSLILFYTLVQEIY